MSFFNSLIGFFGMGKKNNTNKVDSVKKVDIELLKNLEKTLLNQEFHIDFINKFIDEIKEEIQKKDLLQDELQDILRDRIFHILEKKQTNFLEKINTKKNIIFFTGVNGVGKTNTITKLGYWLKKQGKSCVVVPADSFRAAAMEQLKNLCSENNIECQTFGETGVKSSSIVYKAVEHYKKENVDCILVDLAGISYDRTDLLQEVEKSINVGKKQTPEWNHEIITVIDSTMGLSVLKQIEKFVQYAHTTGLVFSKVDIMEKNGIIVTVAERFNLPFFFFTEGQEIEKLNMFFPKDFIGYIV